MHWTPFVCQHVSLWLFVSPLTYNPQLLVPMACLFSVCLRVSLLSRSLFFYPFFLHHFAFLSVLPSLITSVVDNCSDGEMKLVKSVSKGIVSGSWPVSWLYKTIKEHPLFYVFHSSVSIISLLFSLIFSSVFLLFFTSSFSGSLFIRKRKVLWFTDHNTTNVISGFSKFNTECIL